MTHFVLKEHQIADGCIHTADHPAEQSPRSPLLCRPAAGFAVRRACGSPNLPALSLAQPHLRPRLNRRVDYTKGANERQEMNPVCPRRHVAHPLSGGLSSSQQGRQPAARHFYQTSVLLCLSRAGRAFRGRPRRRQECDNEQRVIGIVFCQCMTALIDRLNHA